MNRDKKKMGCAKTFFIICMVFLGLVIIIPGDKKEEKKVEPVKTEVKKEEVKEVKKTPEEIEKEKHDKWIENQFSAWNGSHKALVELIKENMNDPKSFEHVETKYRVENNDLIIVMQYRGKNAFNATITEYVKAKASYKDNTITIIE